jgi:molecular chaperone GrpE
MSEENINQKTELEENLQDAEILEDDSEVLEFEFNEDGEEDLKKTLKKFRADLKQAKKESQEYLTGWQKERADFVNYKKQEEERKAFLNDLIKEKILTNFLSVSDSFNMAFANKEAWEKVDANWRVGVEYIYSQLNNIFEEYGVKTFGKEGEDFDPNLHQSMQAIETEEKEKDHKISSVIQQGYKLGEKVLRPAKVNVYRLK